RLAVMQGFAVEEDRIPRLHRIARHSVRRLSRPPMPFTGVQIRLASLKMRTRSDPEPGILLCNGIEGDESVQHMTQDMCILIVLVPLQSRAMRRYNGIHAHPQFYLVA